MIININTKVEIKELSDLKNINLSDWGKIFSDTLIASVILDRLVHHSSVISNLGNSYRTATALSKLNKN